MSGKDRNSPSTSGAQFGVCSICKDNTVSDINSTRCGHIFHGDCVKRWLENSTICPVCRTNITGDELIKIYPGTQDRNEVPIANSLLTEEELKSLTLEAFKSQNIVYNQLSLLGEKLSAQTTYIETLKAKLEDKEQKLGVVEGERTKLEENLLKLSLSHEELQVASTKLKSEKESCQNKLEEIDATVDFMDTLVEQHKADYQESRNTIGELEDELATIQAACTEMEETISRIQLIKYEIETEEQSERALDDFVEDLVNVNCELRKKMSVTERAEETKDYKIMDLELNVNGLRETLRDVQESYADQSSESKEMEQALRTMQRLYKDQGDELMSLKEERDQYQSDLKDMLDSLKKSEEVVGDVEAMRRQSELLNQSYEGQLADSKMKILNLKRDKKDAVTMVGLKEDVIRTLQDSINTTANSYLDQLDKFAGQSDGITAERGRETDALAILDQRFKILSEEIEKKDNLLIHLMNEKTTLEEERNVKVQIAGQELQDKVDTMSEKIKKLEGEIKDRENMMEEKEMVIAHLVNVVNRYAFNDRDDGRNGNPKKKISSPDGLLSVSISSDGTTRR
ncbi:ELKS/Rab6-interacting/CAST family member 1-like isoform X2 [Bolinopsis microptera]|uniref:ELKS/Rab6-interacting/CAST family member 1-like isoform X2 n=1 Tax=Bolinopsis microptera TaxID=2820187 RepID=UPI00307A7261